MLMTPHRICINTHKSLPSAAAAFDCHMTRQECPPSVQNPTSPPPPKDGLLKQTGTPSLPRRSFCADMFATHFFVEEHSGDILVVCRYYKISTPE